MAQNQPDGATASTAAAQRQYAKGLAVRERILAGTARLLAAQGFAGTSLMEMAAAAGVTKNHILYHYHSKNELVHAVIDAAHAAWRSELATPAEIYPDARDSLRHLLKHAVELDHNAWPHLRLLGLLAAEQGGLPPEVQARLQAVLSEMHAYLRTLAKALRRTGNLPQEHKARAMAGLVLSVLLSVGQLSGGEAGGWQAALEALGALIAPPEMPGAV